jgi:uroporphyrin-III C-methyltransferase
MNAAISTPAEDPRGRVFLVGAGPGDPELLTLKAVRLLRSADVVLHDDLVTHAVLDHARASALLINVGKRCASKRVTQDEINRMLVAFAQRGLAVVRLKSGDPLVFARAAEEMDILQAANIPCEVVPGITAAFAAAAALQCSLTDRRASSGVVFSSGHRAADVPTPSAAPSTRVVYMPGRSFAAIAEEWLAEGLDPSLPCVAISRAAQPDQDVRYTSLASLASLQPGPAPTILVAGEVLRRKLPHSALSAVSVHDAVHVTNCPAMTGSNIQVED